MGIPCPIVLLLEIRDFPFPDFTFFAADGNALNFIVPIVGGSKPFDSHLLCKICYLASNTFDHVLFVDEMDLKSKRSVNGLSFPAIVTSSFHRIYIVLFGRIDGINNILVINTISLEMLFIVDLYHFSHQQLCLSLILISPGCFTKRSQ